MQNKPQSQPETVSNLSHKLQVQSPLQFAQQCYLHAAADTVFDYITAFERLPQWMPFMREVIVDSSKATSKDEPRGAGAIRVIYAPLMRRPTLETVRDLDRANRTLAYSADNASLMGMFTDHTGILHCEAVGEQRTVLYWYTYATPGRSALKRWLGQWVFGFVFWYSLRRLQKHFRQE